MNHLIPWTHRPPAEPGIYGYRFVPEEEPAHVEVQLLKGTLMVVPPGHIFPIPVVEVPGEWSARPVGN